MNFYCPVSGRLFKGEYSVSDCVDMAESTVLVALSFFSGCIHF